MNSVFKEHQQLFHFQSDQNFDFECMEVALCFQNCDWKIEHLQDLKVDLNATKSLLNDKNLDEWGKHTTFTDISSFIINEMKRRLKRQPELLTRAWLKFYEILSEFPALTVADNEFRAVYLCEAPGAFVTATNHFLKSRDSSVKFVWTANTLNPYHEESDVFDAAIVEDRFIRHQNAYEHWYFGDDNTGNILHKSFLNALRCKVGNECDLVTADGGINCVNSPDKQELLMYPLITAEIFIALNCLKVGGCLVVKFFTLFEPQTISLVFLLFNVFRELFAFKPLTSKQGNSENPHLVHKLSNLYNEIIDSQFSFYKLRTTISGKTKGDNFI
ncbi:FtsJ methyltransferase domain-containing protein 1-like protein [Leptotrombidium deliense]|uniref:Cap-specific mRNA (nucleoside-2'-O-)-methyltransferase 2 n=1 Tax=Leptotrombidium deliense TaxID=299467 RepID=A0A443STE0_9ACAR|nr:FtsJ methyltransferase domain-containing protein 1-like protein [Leptotrombidium deliense]